MWHDATKVSRRGIRRAGGDDAQIVRVDLKFPITDAGARMRPVREFRGAFVSKRQPNRENRLVRIGVEVGNSNFHSRSQG